MLKDFLDSLSLNDLNEGLVILVNKPLNWTSFDIVKSKKNKSWTCRDT